MERFTVINIVFVSTITASSRAESNAETPSHIRVPDQTNSSIRTSLWKINSEEAATTLQPLPGDSDSFRDIIEGKKVFVDKTYMIAQLLDAHRRCVLFTRPRRFGKTMFIWMLQAFFHGNGKFFEGTNISSRGNTDDKDGTWKEYPVIHLDFGKINFADTKPSIGIFKKKLYDLVQDAANLNEVSDCEGTGKCRDLTRLIAALYFKFKMPVVILVDEYDRIFADKKLPTGTEDMVISTSKKKKRPTLIELMRKELETFFETIKSNIGYIKLVYVTGVSKLVFASMLGSGADNFVDISMDYPTMVGFSMDELRRHFWPYIEKIAKVKNMTAEEVKQKLHEMYDGYRFSLTDETKVFNPISTINCLKTCVFGSYWLSTASLKLVVHKIIKSRISLNEFKKVVIPQEDILRRYSPLSVHMPLSVTLLVYGYLTIKVVDNEKSTLTLDFPNKEVEEALNNAVQVIQNVKHPEEIFHGNSEKLRLSLMNQDIKQFSTCMNNIEFRSHGGQYDAGIKDEFSLTRVINAILRQGGIPTEVGKVIFDDMGERKGDLDLQILFQQNHYINEIKYNKPNAVEGMLQLIEYIVKYESGFRKTLLEFRKGVISSARINDDYNIILVSINMKENKFRDFISLPYRIKLDGSGELRLGQMKMVSSILQIPKLKGELNALARRYPDSNLLKNVHNLSCVRL